MKQLTALMSATSSYARDGRNTFLIRRVTGYVTRILQVESVGLISVAEYMHQVFGVIPNDTLGFADAVDTSEAAMEPLLNAVTEFRSRVRAAARADST